MSEEKSDALGVTLAVWPLVVGVAVAATGLESAEKAAVLGGALVTTALVLFDADRWKLRAWPYVLGSFLFWLVALPVYVHQRGKRGAPKRLALCLVSLVLFVAGMVASSMRRGDF